MAGSLDRDKIILELNCKNYRKVDLKGDSKYKQINQAAEAGTLPEPKGYVSPRAALYHKPGMMYERVEYDDGTTEKRIKPELILAFSDERGRVILDLDQVELARQILKTAKAIDKNVGVDSMSALTEEEIMGPPPPPPSKGGRGKRKIVRILPC